MPSYDYKCVACAHVQEVSHPMAVSPEILCPNCVKPMSKGFSAPLVAFKGTGWGKDAR